MSKEEKYISAPLYQLSVEQLKVLASDIRADILTSVNANGGHLSSNLGTVELTMALLRSFDPLTDDLIFDVGHQTYTYKILTGRSLKRLRQFDGEAMGMDIAKKLNDDKSYTIAIIGDSSISSGLSMEALNLLSTINGSRLIVIINDNGMSIGKDVGFMAKKFQHLRNSRFYFRTSNAFGKSMSKHKFTWKLFLKLRNLKDHFKSMILKDTVFEAMGLKYIGPFDGHDFMNLELAFSKAKNLVNNGPVVVHIITKKGFGYPLAAKDEKGDFHGVAPYFTEPKSNSNTKIDYTSLKADELLHLMDKDEKAYVITPAMEKGSNLETIFKKYPERCLDVGIAEENAVSLASGLALKGFKPIVDIYSTFMQRSYDEIIEDISREKTPCLFLVERAGLVGQDGPSHHGIYDVAMLKSIPNCRVYMPYDNKTNHILFEKVGFKYKCPMFFRYSKEKVIETTDGHNLLNHVLYNQNNCDSLYIGIGPKGYQVLEQLKDNDIDSLMLVNLLPTDDILDSLNLAEYKSIYLYDPYGIYQGTCEHISDYLKRKNFACVLHSFTISNDFVTFGDNDKLYEALGISVEQVITKILNLHKLSSNN